MGPEGTEGVTAASASGPLVPTPSQTAGPFVSIGTSWNADGSVVVGRAVGRSILITGTVLDGEGEAVTDALLEFFQADPRGRFPPGTEEGWGGFGRSLTDGEGRYRLTTLKPGVVAPAGARPEQAPHVEVSIFARGLQQRLVTRLYFSDEAGRNAADPVLALVEVERRRRLVATEAGGTYHLDFVLQGRDESVFFAP